MARSMWRGAISFGMVAIPVRMYLATESKNISFRLLCPHCHTPIRNKRWCPHEDREVPWSEAVRGWEVSKDEFAVIEDADLDQLPLASSKSIDILTFVPDSDIEAGVYMEKAYYLEPEPAGAKPYALLRGALEKTGRVAVGKIAFREREHLCRLALHGNALLLNTLRWPDEIRDLGEIKIPQADATTVHAREMDMAVMLVENLSSSFDPSQYRDTYRDAVLQVVEAKLAGRTPEAAPPAEPAKIMDLMTALRASVEATKAAKPARTAAAPATATKPRPVKKPRSASAARRDQPARRAS